MFMPVKTTGVFLGANDKRARFKIGDKEYDIGQEDIYEPEFDGLINISRGTVLSLSIDGWWATANGVKP